MENSIVFSITVYAVAIAISLLVAALIRVIVVLLPRLQRPGSPATWQPGEPAFVGVPPEHVAAIAATLAAVTEPRHIVHIEDRGRTSAWAAEGRMLHQTSHAVPRAPRR